MNLYVYNGPLQYFLCRLIQSTFDGDAALGIQYTECGDFSAVFAEIDALMGVKPLKSIKFGLDDDLSHIGPVDRLFLSNRFNPCEVEIYLQVKRKTRRICAFEDGLSLYMDHCFFNPIWRDDNHRQVLHDKYRLFLRQYVGGRHSKLRPFYLTAKVFDEFHSIFQDIPGRRLFAKRVSLAPAFRALADTGPAQEPLRGALVLSQSLTTDGLVDAQDYMAFLKELTQDLVLRNGSVYFKQHPRDPADVVESLSGVPGCSLLPRAYQRAPVELFLAKHPGVTAYGFWSSTLAYAAGGLDRTAYTFAPSFMRQVRSEPKLAHLWGSMEPILRRYGVSTYVPGGGA